MKRLLASIWLRIRRCGSCLGFTSAGLLVLAVALVVTQGCGAVPAETGLQAPDDDTILPATGTDEGGTDSNAVQESDGTSDSGGTIIGPAGVIADPEEIDVGEVLGATWQILAASSLDPSADMIATAFAIDENRLATNAHVIFGLANILSTAGGLGAVVQHETGTALEIVNIWAHPDYDGSAATSPDVGVIEVDGILPSWLPLADDAIVQGLQVLDEVTLCGFPGDVSLLIDFANLQPGDEFRPRASCFTGSISSLRPFDPSVPATPSNSQVVQHDISTTGGTSGSPVLDDSGRVIAVHAAATTDEGGTNRFASRTDTLRDLIQLINSGSLGPLQTEGDSGADATTIFDVAQVLDGDWVLITTTGDEWACMEFDRGVLVFYDALCYVDSVGFLPNDLDYAVEAVSDGQSILLSYSFTIGTSTWDEILLGNFVDEDWIDVFHTIQKREAGSELMSFPAVLVRQGF